MRKRTKKTAKILSVLLSLSMLSALSSSVTVSFAGEVPVSQESTSESAAEGNSEIAPPRG